jgi:hypothetical protein
LQISLLVTESRRVSRMSVRNDISALLTQTEKL